MNHDELQAAANKALWWGGAMIAVVALWNKLVACAVAAWGFLAMPFRVMKKLNDTVEQLTIVVKSLENTMNGKMGAMGNKLTAIEELAEIAYRHSLIQFDSSATAHFECVLPSGECTYVNPALAALFGMEMEQLVGWGWTAAVHPDDIERVKSHWLSSIEHWRGYRTRYRIIRLGEVISVDASGIIITDSTGRPLRVWGTVTKMPIHT